MSEQFDICFNKKTRILGCLVIVLLLLSSWVVSPVTASAQEFQDPDSSFNQSATIVGTNASGTPPSVNTKSDKGTAGQVGTGQALGLSSYRLTIFSMLSFLGSAIAWLGGSLLDAAIGLFTINMKATAHYFGLDLAINAMWSIIRDLFNLLFIFGLIWIGFQLILGINESGAKKTLGLLVVAALLINFSLFIAQVVVDFGNVAAVQIHELMRPERSTKLLGFEVSNISDSFTSLTGFDRLNGSEGKQSISKAGFKTEEVDTIGNAFVLGLLFLVFYSMLGFIFAAGAILLFTRFVALIVLMIFSPMLFLGFVLPAFGSFGKTWWHYFFNQVLIAPAFLFMLYLSLRALQGMTRMQEFTLIGFTLYLMIVSAFLIASLMIARSLGKWGALQFMNFGEGAVKQLQGYAGRNTVGRVADGLDKRLEKMGVSETSTLRQLTRAGAGAKFDSGFSRTQVREAGEKARIKGEEQRERSDAARALSLGSRIGATTTQIAEMQRAVRELSNAQAIKMIDDTIDSTPEYEHLVAGLSDAQYRAALDSNDITSGQKQTLQGARRVAVGQRFTDREVRRILAGGTATTHLTPAQAGFRTASQPELRTMGSEYISRNAEYLSQQQFDDIMKSDHYVEQEKNDIRMARAAGLDNMFRANPASVFENRKPDEVSQLGSGILTDSAAARYLTGEHLRDILRNNRLNPNQRATLAGNVRALMPVVGPPPSAATRTALDFLDSPGGAGF